ncbi:MAG TPA: LysR family transcriptional regulator [Steroidobacteraceae bacterium]|nr:LysR family transcriptional regulator [Steroidobacteraceae bacterium]
MDMVANLRAFLAVARYGGFSQAARQLNLVPSVAAKRVSQLEHAVGSRLFERSTRRVELTEAGELFQVRARNLIADLDEALSGLRRSGDRLEGRILMMVPTTLHMLVLSDALSDFLLEHSHITLELALVDRSVNPAEEGFDLAISGHAASSYEGVIDVPLHPFEQVLCASPDYLRRRGTPAHPHDLEDHDGLFFKPLGTAWRLESDQGQLSVDVHPRLIANDNVTLRAAALAGNGIAMLPRYVAGDALERGRLVALLPEFALPRAWFRAHVTQHRAKLARISALLAWLKDALEKALPRMEG